MQMKNTFFKINLYRTILFVGLTSIILIASIFGPAVRVAIFPEGRAFRHHDGNMTVHFMDVGHGNAVAIRTPDNKVILIDGGGHIYYSRVSNYLQTRVITNANRRAPYGRIDYVIVTNTSPDSIGSLSRIMQSFDIGTVVRPIIQSNSPHDRYNDTVPLHWGITLPPVYTEVINDAYENADEVKVTTAGLRLPIVANNNSAWTLKFHTPSDALWYTAINHDPRQISPIMTLEFMSHIFVFTGSSGFPAEGDFILSETAREMFTPDRIENSAVHLQVGQNGGPDATGNPFLSMIRPTTAVISVGNRLPNRYPDTSLVNRLRFGHDIRDIHVTRDTGNVAIRVNNDDSWTTFLGFFNPANLWWLSIILMVSAFFISFTNFKKPQTEIADGQDDKISSAVGEDDYI